VKRIAGSLEELSSPRPHAEEPFGSASSLRRRLTQSGRDEALCFEAPQSDIDVSMGDSASRTLFDLLNDRHNVRLITQTDAREQDELLEFSE
jgi:hypothetical protein